MSEETDTFLAHHGVKGQKWGTRRKANRARYVTNLQRGKAAKKAGTELNATQKQALAKHKNRVHTGVEIGLRVGIPLALGAVQISALNRGSVSSGQKTFSKMLGDGTLNMKYAKVRRGASVVTSLK